MKIRASALFVLLFFLASFIANSTGERKSMVTIDFKVNYPYVFWISTWGKDDTYPKGFRYKVLSSWSPKEDLVEAVLIFQESDYSKSEMRRWQSDSASISSFLANFLPSLEEEYGIEFEKQDYSAVRTVEGFEKLVEENGWQ